MEINVLTLGYIRTNCYLIKTEKAAVVIDPGFYSDKVKDFLNENKDKQRVILLTHAHFDHIGGAQRLREETDTLIAIGENDEADLRDLNKNLTIRFRAKVNPFSADILLKNQEKFTVGDLEFKVIETPGHTIGSVCYLINDILFSGDTLFYQSVGRTDFDGADSKAIIKSVKMLFELDGNITVFAGHGPKTTINHERQFNPFII